MAEKGETAEGKISEDDLLSMLQTMEQDASQYNTGPLRTARDQLIREFFQRPYGNEEPGWSDYVSGISADTIEWMLPDILDQFLTTDKAVEFKPTRASEVDGAKQATDAANHVFHQWNNGFLTLYTAFKDALQVRNCAIHWYTEEKKVPRRELFRELTNIEIAIKVQQLKLDPKDHEKGWEVERFDPETGEEVEGDPDPQDPRRFNGRICYSVKEKTIRTDAFEPENLLVSRTWTSPLLARCPYVCRMVEVTLSDIREMGFDDTEVDASDLAGSNAPPEQDNLRRKDRTGDPTNVQQNRPEGVAVDDESQTTGWLRYEWILADVDGDGIAERRQIIRLEDLILSNEEWPDVPVCTGSPILVQHRWDGLAVGDQLSDVQMLDTDLMRAVINNAYAANSPRRVVLSTPEGAPRANMDDILDGRIGGTIREYTAGAIRTEMAPYVGNQMEPLLQRVDQIREQRSGVTKQRMGMDPNSIRTDRTLGESQMIDASSKQRVKLIARIFAETIVKPVFQGILQLLTSGDFDKLFMELRGQFVEYDPNDWNGNYRMKANVGLGTGDKEQKQITLRGILASQMQIAPTPIGYDQSEPVMGPDGQPVKGPDGKPQMRVIRPGLVKPAQIFNTLEQLAELGGFENVGEFFTNPGEAPMPTPPPSPPPYQIIVEQMRLKDAAEKRAQEQAAAERLKALDIEAQQRDKANQNEVQAANDERDAMRASEEASTNEKLKAMEIELGRYKVDRDNETKIQLQLMSTPGATLPPGYAVDPKTGLVMGPDRLASMMQALEAIYTQQAAPAQVITHPETGEVVGVNKGGVVRPVVRDETGKITGLGDPVQPSEGQ